MRWSNCPLCDSKLLINNSEFSATKVYKCKNTCFAHFIHNNSNRTEYVVFFNDIQEQFFIYSSMGKFNSVELIGNRIKYWKENDRYLTELMTK